LQSLRVNTSAPLLPWIAGSQIFIERMISFYTI
jgi:hypothetical protein